MKQWKWIGIPRNRIKQNRIRIGKREERETEEKWEGSKGEGGKEGRKGGSEILRKEDFTSTLGYLSFQQGAIIHIYMKVLLPTPPQVWFLSFSGEWILTILWNPMLPTAVLWFNYTQVCWWWTVTELNDYFACIKILKIAWCRT